MRGLTTAFLGGLLCVVFMAFNAGAEEERPTASATMGVFSKYIWRGYELSDDSLVIQPSITVGYKGFSVNLWGNLDTDWDDRVPATSDKTEWTETDMTLEYGREFGPVRLAAGYIYYALDGIDDSQEVYLSGSWNVLLTPTLTIYREVSHLPGWYFKFALGHSFDLGKGISLDLAGSVGYYYSDDEAFVEVDDSLNPTTEKYRALHDGNLSVGLKIPLAKYLVLNPTVAYSFPLSNKADNLLTSTSFSGDSDFLYGGINLTLTF
ncbi:MAG: hypothetical protein JXL84_06805 [Deltaproteobacteria bacterium]|nr:hypothetical protein [Deltaproteobacteria bacterium]